MDNSKTHIHILSDSPIGDIAIVWSNDTKFLIEEVILSNPEKTSIEIANEKYPNSTKAKKTPKKLKKVIKEFRKYFNEKEANFSIKYLNMDKLTNFQREVLTAQFNTRKGSINSYTTLAKSVNRPKAYRAVGTALARNPFPIIIPCHRTVKADRTIGGFGGYKDGLTSKQILLEIDGIEVEGRRVISESHILSLDKKKQTKITSYKE